MVKSECLQDMHISICTKNLKIIYLTVSDKTGENKIVRDLIKRVQLHQYDFAIMFTARCVFYSNFVQYCTTSYCIGNRVCQAPLLLNPRDCLLEQPNGSEEEYDIENVVLSTGYLGFWRYYSQTLNSVPIISRGRTSLTWWQDYQSDLFAAYLAHGLLNNHKKWNKKEAR